jgi:hypothetical protein
VACINLAFSRALQAGIVNHLRVAVERIKKACCAAN